MPSKNYCMRLNRYYENEEEKKELDRAHDNMLTKINYWKRNWNYDINLTDYNEFNKHSKAISKIKNIHKFFCNLDKDNIRSSEELFLYTKFHKQIEFAWNARHYIKTLKKINDDKLQELSISTDSDSNSEEIQQ